MAVSFSNDQLTSITGGRWLSQCTIPDTITDVCDDSRSLAPGSLFVAIVGALTDGHRFLMQAAQAGAAAICVQRIPDAPILQECARTGTGCLIVNDTLTAFHALARAHRLRFPQCRVIAVTGSSGKTSTKEMIAAILEQRWPGAVLKTQGNTNNFFGVPRNLFRLDQHHKAAVLELGTNAPGEIARLAHLVDAHIGVICNIGRAHLEKLINEDGVAREKGSLLTHLQADGLAIYPADSPYAAQFHQLTEGRQIVTFGNGLNANIRVTYHGPQNQGYGITLDGADFEHPCHITWQLGGQHQAMNAAAAAAATLRLGTTPENIIAGLSTCNLPGMRMNTFDIDGITWVNDAYNANPDSVRASLLWFRDLLNTTPGPAWIILGDMLELGERAEFEHLNLLREAGNLLPEARIIAIGPIMAKCATELSLPGFTDTSAARGYIKRSISSGSRVLLKGSRGIALENLIPNLQKPGQS